MHESQNKLMGYAIMAIVAYYVLAAIVPLLIVAVVAMVVWRAYEQHKGR